MNAHPDIAPSTDEDQTLALLAHLALTVGLFTGLAYLAGPIIWLLKKDDSPYIDRHGREVTNVLLTGALYVVIGTILTIVTFGIGAIIIWPLFGLYTILIAIFGVINGIAAKEGRFKPYPLTARFFKGSPDESRQTFVPEI